MGVVNRLSPSWRTLALILLATLGVAGSRTLHEFSGHDSTNSSWSVECQDSAETPSKPACPTPAENEKSHDDCHFCQSKSTSVATIVASVESTWLLPPTDVGRVIADTTLVVLARADEPRASRAPPIA